MGYRCPAQTPWTSSARSVRTGDSTRWAACAPRRSRARRCLSAPRGGVAHSQPEPQHEPGRVFFVLTFRFLYVRACPPKTGGQSFVLPAGYRPPHLLIIAVGTVG